VQFRGYNYFHQPLLMDIDRRSLLASDRPFLREMLSKVGKVMESLVRLLEWNKYA
jgi:glycogen debranching enzyme